jgi:hypothetical protein
MAKKSKGFAFQLSKEKLLECHNLSAKDKLDWLEEANNFINEALTKEQRDRWEIIKNQV